MGGLQRFEQRLESIISGAFARAFRSAVQPVEIAAALQRECDNNAQILSRERRMVPNDFHVELSPSDLERLAPYDTALADELTHQVQDHADAQGYVFPGPIAIDFEPAHGPGDRPVPDPQPRPGAGAEQRHPHPGTTRAGRAGDQRHQAPAHPARAGRRTRYRGRRADQRPRA